MSKQLLHTAAQAWDISQESFDHVIARIHDGATEENLHLRADGYLKVISGYFPYIDWKKIGTAMEIGSGAGSIMEAVERFTDFGHKRKIIGLDISETMIEGARNRLKEHPKSDVFSFMHYDGIKVPLPDESVDFIYSVAALQHIPKPFVYNLFFEIKRLLKPKGFAAMHFLPFSILPGLEQAWSWRSEIDTQIGVVNGLHWHHYYSADELNNVLTVTGFKHIDVQGDLYACVSKSAVQMPKAETTPRT